MKHDCVTQNQRMFRKEIPYAIHYWRDITPCGIPPCDSLQRCKHTLTGFFRWWADGKLELIA